MPTTLLIPGRCGNSSRSAVLLAPISMMISVVPSAVGSVPFRAQPRHVDGRGEHPVEPSRALATHPIGKALVSSAVEHERNPRPCCPRRCPRRIEGPECHPALLNRGLLDLGLVDPGVDTIRQRVRSWTAVGGVKFSDRQISSRAHSLEEDMPELLRPELGSFGAGSTPA